MVVSSGKWYWEVRVFGTASTKIGIMDARMVQHNSLNVHDRPGSIYYQIDGQKMVDNAASAYGSSFAKSDIIGVALDMDNNTVEFYKIDSVSGVSTAQGSISFSTVSSKLLDYPGLLHVVPTISLASQCVSYNFGQDGAFGSYGAMNQGVWFVASNNNQDENDIGDQDTSNCP